MSHTLDDHLLLLGFRLERPLIAGGGIQRFSCAEKRHSKSGWALLFPEGDAGFWGDWRTDAREYWREDGRKFDALTIEEKEEYVRKQAIARKMLTEEKERLALLNLKHWNMIEEGIECEYLARKKVKAHGIKIGIDGNAYVPLRDIDGKFWNYQNISSTPKMFARGRTSGCFHIIEGSRERVILTSGYATAAAIHEATGYCVIVCFGDSNIIEVGKILKEAKWGNLCAAVDNDSGGSNSGNIIGKRFNDELGLPSIMPDTPGDFNDHSLTGQSIHRYFFDTTPIFSFGALRADLSPMPDDIIAPRILTEGGMLVFGGAPKVGKSDFMLTWLAHMAGGLPFMEMTPPRPLRIFYLQAEVQYHYLKERVKGIEVQHDVLAEIGKNLFITPQVRMLLDEGGVKTVGNTIRHCFGNESPDIICIDPIANVYDQESENDNAQMMRFLSQRVEALRAYAAPHTGFMLVHHTKKIGKEELIKDPFLMFSGASSLRRYYTSGMLMFRPDEEVSECVLTYEIRNGPRIKNINIDKINGRWNAIESAHSRISKIGESSRNNEERRRKVSIIIDELHRRTADGFSDTPSSLSEYLGGTSGLGSSRTIFTLLKEMLAQGDIQEENIDNGRRKCLIVPSDI